MRRCDQNAAFFKISTRVASPFVLYRPYYYTGTYFTYSTLHYLCSGTVRYRSRNRSAPYQRLSRIEGKPQPRFNYSISSSKKVKSTVHRIVQIPCTSTGTWHSKHPTWHPIHAFSSWFCFMPGEAKFGRMETEFGRMETKFG